MDNRSVKHISARVARFFKIGMIVFCFMCLFFATYMASQYEHQKTQTEIHMNKAKELEEKIQEVSSANRELLQIRSVLVQEKEQMAKEMNALREKCLEFEDWKHAMGRETTTSDSVTDLQPIDDGNKRFPEGNEPIPSTNQP